ncbi:MAG: VCBS repeat-containing protein, partial [Verrucomicrobiales bacterium]|nr:VCBS repeat-containing protein [Verrucomicrobiales bacterium]
ADLVLTRPQGGARLFKNLGGFKFADVTEKSATTFEPPAGALVSGAAFADVDSDGHLDLFINTYSWDDRLFLNNGDGTFRAAPASTGLNHPGAAVKTIFADYDLDGDLDAFTLTNRLEPTSPVKPQYTGKPGNYQPTPEFAELVSVIRKPDGTQQFTKAGQFDRLFKNNLVETGQLSFTDVAETSGITGADHGLDAIWWDCDSDGYPDLYVANDFTDPDRFYHNNQNGTFTEVARDTLPHTPWFTMGAAAADFDNDGLQDLLATDMAATTHFRNKVAMGSMDAIAWFLDSAEPRQYMKNALYLNSGTPRFREAAELAGLASTDWTWSVKAADFDSDGHTDVFVTNGFTRDYMDSDFAAQLAREGKADDPAAWENAPDLVETNLAFKNTGTLHFENTSAEWGLDLHAVSFGAAVADLDNDGDPDLVTNNFDAPPALYRNTSHTGNVLKVATPVGTTVTVTTPDGHTQTKTLHPGNGFMSADDPGHLLFGLGTNKTVTTLTANPTTLSDIPAGHLVTLTSSTKQVAPETSTPIYTPTNHFAGILHTETPFDDFARQPLLPYRLSANGPPLAFADIDNDGDPDAYLGGSAGHPARLLTNNGSKFTTTPQTDHAASEDSGTLFFDADNDGDPDLFVTSGSNEFPPGHPNYADRLYLNDGTGKFTATNIPTINQPTGAPAAADIDNDGDLDIFVGGLSRPAAYPAPSPSRLLLNDGHANFTDATPPALAKTGRVTATLWTDIDNDDDPDLVLAIDYGPLLLATNNAGQLADPTPLTNHTGWWRSLAAVDIDADGDLDLAAGNLGLNTKYHPSTDHPQLLFFGDFENNATAHIIEAKQSGQTLLPVRGLSCSSNAMPFIKNKLPTFHDFAAASLTEIYPTKSLDSALRLEANTAASGIFFNDGSGKFTFQPFPHLAQIAPVPAIAVLDANGDNHPDLFLAENDFSAQRETGHHDGGLGTLLLTSKSGHLTPLRPDQSGISIPHQATTAHTIDLDSNGTPELVISTQNGPIFSYSSPTLPLQPHQNSNK